MNFFCGFFVETIILISISFAKVFIAKNNKTKKNPQINSVFIWLWAHAENKTSEIKNSVYYFEIKTRERETESKQVQKKPTDWLKEWCQTQSRCENSMLNVNESMNSMWETTWWIHFFQQNNGLYQSNSPSTKLWISFEENKIWFAFDLVLVLRLKWLNFVFFFCLFYLMLNWKRVAYFF